MYFSLNIILKLFLSGLCVTALGIYAIQTGLIDVIEIRNRLFPSHIQNSQYSGPYIAKQSIGPLPSKNSSSCSCTGFALTNQGVPQNELMNLQSRRFEQFQQYKRRMATNMEELILAQPNSPLQYPIQGVIVTPLTKSRIPGLSVHALKRGPYKVSLKVKSGVLSVEGVLDGQQVDGHGQKNLSISSSKLEELNDLLSRVTYTNTIYHINTRDLVHFSFENHEALFPIKIQRTSVPVLYDPGTDINSQVTITTKTFLRYHELNILIGSIRQLYPTIKIIVADDSLVPEKVNGSNIEHYIMPPAQGWFAGRNLAISQVTTKYFLWVDDDFLFNKDTRIESFVEIMEKIPELDVIGGSVKKNQFFFRLQYEEGDEEGGCLRRIKTSHQLVPGFRNCVFVDGVVNYFLARTDAVQRVGFDPFLKRVAHTEFFIDALGKLLIASCKGFSIDHQKRLKQSNYQHYRHPGKRDEMKKIAHQYFRNHLKCIYLH